jgi:hypothetical protein
MGCGMCKLIFSLLLPLSLIGCATTNDAPIAGERTMQDRFGNAIISPLSDLNIVQTAIPAVVQDAVKDPYYVPSDTTCVALAEQIHKLDMVLGMDLDVAALQAEKTMAEKSGEFIGNEAIGSVERTINGFIPFRGWIRKLTGAERHSNEVREAIAAGIVHRAFLKGIGEAHGCQPPAAPVKRPMLEAPAPVTVPVSNPLPVQDAAPAPSTPVPQEAPKATDASSA